MANANTVWIREYLKGKGVPNQKIGWKNNWVTVNDKNYYKPTNIVEGRAYVDPSELPDLGAFTQPTPAQTYQPKYQPQESLSRLQERIDALSQRTQQTPITAEQITQSPDYQAMAKVNELNLGERLAGLRRSFSSRNMLRGTPSIQAMTSATGEAATRLGELVPGMVQTAQTRQQQALQNEISLLNALANQYERETGAEEAGYKRWQDEQLFPYKLREQETDVSKKEQLNPLEVQQKQDEINRAAELYPLTLQSTQLEVQKKEQEIQKAADEIRRSAEMEPLEKEKALLELQQLKEEMDQSQALFPLSLDEVRARIANLKRPPASSILSPLEGLQAQIINKMEKGIPLTPKEQQYWDKQVGAEAEPTEADLRAQALKLAQNDPSWTTASQRDRQVLLDEYITMLSQGTAKKSRTPSKPLTPSVEERINMLLPGAASSPKLPASIMFPGSMQQEATPGDDVQQMIDTARDNGWGAEQIRQALIDDGIDPKKYGL